MNVPPKPLPMRDGSVLVPDLIDAYMAEYAGRDPTRASRLAWWRKHLDGQRIDAVTDDHVAAALDQLAASKARYYAGVDAEGEPIVRARNKKLAPATINRYAASLGSVFTWAQRRRIPPKGWVHPCRGVEQRKEAGGRTRFLSDDELARLLAACRLAKWRRLYALALVAVTTGCRRGELMSLRWADVDLDRGLVHLATSKNGDPRAVPLTPAVVDELRSFAGAPAALVFASQKSATKPYAFDAAWSAALESAGIEKFTFHGLRHTTASYLARGGASLHQVGDLLGHRSVVTTRRYAHLVTADRSALVGRVLGGIR